MNSSREKLITLIAIGALALAVISGSVGYWVARRGSSAMTDMQSSSSTSAAVNAAGGGRKPLFWYDPMVPNQHFDKPGKSPFMDMQLVPKYADEGRDEATIKIDPSVVQNLGVRLTTVRRSILSQPIEAIGNVVFNQRNVAVLQARTNGFVARVYARAPGDVVRRDAPLVDLLVPEWAGAQAEFLALLASGDRELTAAARQRLLLLGMPQELISTIETSHEQHTTVTIRAPIAGVIDSLDIREGMTVSSGATLAKLNGLDTVWVEAAIPEAQGALAGIGRSVQVRLTAYPGDVFQGQVIAVLPEANTQTRTLRVRIEIANRDGRLRPGMFAQVRLDEGGSTPMLYVASEAVIHTGTRTVVIVSEENGRFSPTEVKTGREVDGKTVILEGLTEGQRVVASGQFLIDSEASLKGVLARLGGGDGAPAPEGPVGANQSNPTDQMEHNHPISGSHP